MKYFFIVLIILKFNHLALYSQELDSINLHQLDSTYASGDYKQQSQDSNLVFIIPPTNQLNPSEFMYANNQRTTITGMMPYHHNQLSPLTISIVGGTITGIFVAQHIYQANTIWKEQAAFKFIEDGEYAIYADKAGHFFGAYLSAYTLTEAMVQSGFGYETAYVGGGILGLAYSTYVEVLDGYGANWGFSPSDFYADVAGAGLYIGQYYFPYLQNFTPKFTYIPPKWHGYHDRSPHDMFIDNYSAHTLWLSINVHNMLPEDLQDYFPPWLELSVGYAARNLALPVMKTDPNGKQVFDDAAHLDSYRYSNLVWGNPKFIIALDYNLTKLIPKSYPFVNWLVQTLNLFKFPAPAIEFDSKGAKFFLLYPFELK